MKFVAKTLYGLENVLEKELEGIGAQSIKPLNRAVSYEGDMNILYRSNYCLRTALSILMPVAEFRIKSKDDLYRGGLRIKWEKYMAAEDTFSVVPVVKSPLFSHSGYPGLILKDSVADYFRNKSGSRPSVHASDPDLVINLHISNNDVTVSLDSTVVPLYKRGYRKEQSEAPINEVLAAGILLMSGWDGSNDLLDPMCGSGTFPIEAAMIAGNIPPGRLRDYFGFMRWKEYDPGLFDSIKTELNSLAVEPAVSINGSDISDKAIKQAGVNVAAARAEAFITLQVSDFKDLKSEGRNKTLFLNPPYGLRLQPEEIDELYSITGATLKHNFEGCTAWLITPNKEALKHVGLKPARKYNLFNGAVECTLLKYELYGGSRKRAAVSQKEV